MNKDYVIINGELYHADELYHYGVKGMRWGHRKYQNEDGSLTPKGQKRLANNLSNDRYTRKQAEKTYEEVEKAYNSVLSDDDRNQIKSARERYLKAVKKERSHDDIDMWNDHDSKEYKEWCEESRKSAIKDIQENSPKIWDEIVKDTGGDLKRLDNDSYYETVYLSHLGKHEAKYRAKWEKNNQDKVAKREAVRKEIAEERKQAEKEYYSAVENATNKILGEYSNKHNISNNERSKAAKNMDSTLKTSSDLYERRRKYKK